MMDWISAHPYREMGGTCTANSSGWQPGKEMGWESATRGRTVQYCQLYFVVRQRAGVQIFLHRMTAQ